MYCQGCGASAEGPFCTNCGMAQPAQPRPTPVLTTVRSGLSPAVAARQAEYREELHGVNGWLLWLCVTLLVGIPITHIGSGAKTLADPTKWHSILEIVKATLNIAIAIYSFTAGLRLWLLKPNAPQYAKDFFLISTAAVVAVSLALYAANGSQAIAWVVLRRISISGLWYLYLTYSDRVLITYGADQRPAT